MTDVRVIMGSASDIEVAKKVTKILRKFDIDYEVSVISAHRALNVLEETMGKDDTKVYIGIAGMAAHLAGVMAGMTIKPVIGLPVGGSNTSGLDALLSMVQMPKGVPVATVALNGGDNAALLAIQILALSDENLSQKLNDYKKEMLDKVIEDDKNLEEI
ncbi:MULTISPECIES: 5-(carboxyamino)imidazole ribonucleotide mutase [Anaerococcus]|uniref:N5-carboxyaminoimidazole ribonucleotide mutase n=1 Tax=Anaerococcus nagyae TaxID=1755241 RepID=A0A3E2TK36_9FIRM|nr:MULTISPECIES: 5-(carboxyamino)imidazole ribonucleotide mutase [Anaerococcus]MDU1829086.1 5-(carboxyamino)imidazole ribonucleotide mutase [Anaerococcus sp.]MDU1865333.1 5-(carboxyamino)imidazole ribonucleotide mutase [Anaerococcus sp.]MDU2353678.1 5-(carboxyamino)imidazole ribonucleotide mutase [Anaerococcus sp.]MDU3211516.1 5-(carboxyamino)imidazole ribonucleotide mutase [Anaerococcus sp.]RGB77328.1 5-(carboxyamino)imidazole ribonucleotide mutase [Anaerococcus nagyae]